MQIDTLTLPTVTETEALTAFVAAVAYMRERGFLIPTILEGADLLARNAVPSIKHP